MFFKHINFTKPELSVRYYITLLFFFNNKTIDCSIVPLKVYYLKLKISVISSSITFSCIFSAYYKNPILNSNK